MKTIIEAAGRETNIKDPANAHNPATGVEIDMGDAARAGVAGLTRSRGELGVSGLTPGRDPVLRQRADEEQQLMQPAPVAAPVLHNMEAAGKKPKGPRTK
jgi:hypothetical protein